ncbi:uncharacterized protein LOC134966188 isoform X2 [Pseudophryne corroboree]|uniref:uncharacterized protein LOC134966188 isoform X2 n=1 Tax=Pseudophryne corroboree TaxID=495146 RepID=UPI003081A340
MEAVCGNERDERTRTDSDPHHCSEPEPVCLPPENTETASTSHLEQEVAGDRRFTKRKTSKVLKKKKSGVSSRKRAHNYCPQNAIGEVQSSIGDLVWAAELMEKASEATLQDLGEVNECIVHDHGDYCVPDDPELLKQMVRELKKTNHQQNQLLQSLQQACNAKEMQCEALQEKWDNERWVVVSDMCQQISLLESEIWNLRCEKEILEKKNKDLQEQLDRSSGTVLYLGQQVKNQEHNRDDTGFCMNSIKNESKWVRFYTGFDSYEHLTDFLGFVTADQKLCTGRIRKKTEVGPQSALSLEDQLLLVLTRLRLGLLLQDLAFRFRISESTVSRYWLNWTELLHARLTQHSLGKHDIIKCSPFDHKETRKSEVRPFLPEAEERICTTQLVPRNRSPPRPLQNPPHDAGAPQAELGPVGGTSSKFQPQVGSLPVGSLGNR